MKKKKNISQNISLYPKFLELQCLVDDLVDSLRIINVYQCLFILNMLFDEVERGLGHEAFC